MSTDDGRGRAPGAQPPWPAQHPPGSPPAGPYAPLPAQHAQSTPAAYPPAPQSVQGAQPYGAPPQYGRPPHAPAVYPAQPYPQPYAPPAAPPFAPPFQPPIQAPQQAPAYPPPQHAPFGQPGYPPPTGAAAPQPHHAPFGPPGYPPPTSAAAPQPALNAPAFHPGAPAGSQAAPAPRRTHLVATVQPPTGQGFGAMAALSMRRAFRLRIEPNEILDDERRAMAVARPPITDETQQAFLAWRRSVLFMAALLMIPVALLHAYENLKDLGDLPEGWKSLTYLNVAVETGFTLFLWTQVRRWTAWRRQARALSWAWLAYFLTPFLMFLYPLASAFDYGTAPAEQIQQLQVGVGIVIGAGALMQLAPKVISLLQGLIRASIATKSLFPGASAPGWLMVVAAPLYMIIFYIFVLLPYHFTGSSLVIAGMLLVLAAKGSLVRAGLGLTRPMLPDTARTATKKTLTWWMVLLIAGATSIVAGLWALVSKASLLTLVSFGLSMGSNILLLTLIATDTLITALDRARGTSAEERQLADEAAVQVAAFTAVRTHDAG